MTMLSVLFNSAAILILATPTSAWIGFDMYSNGHYWTGWAWSHKPRHAETNNCVCMKGYAETGPLRGQLHSFCSPGMWFARGHEDQTVGVHLDMSRPIDISIHGDDALWVDRFIIRSANGSRDRTYGSNNQDGWCLSTDRNEYFDKWAKHDGCTQTITLLPSGRTANGRGRAGYYKQSSLLQQSVKNCAIVRKNDRRRVEAGDAPLNLPMVEMDSSEGSEVLNTEDLDDDPEIHSGSHIEGQQAQIVSGLQNAIKQLVRDNSEVTNEQINSVLNSMLGRALDDSSSSEEMEGSLQEERMGTLVRRLVGN